MAAADQGRSGHHPEPSRLAFVLHDVFAVPFGDIGRVLGRSPDAAKMLASRARHRVRHASAENPDVSRQRKAAEAFLAASRRGDFAALLELLAPDVVARAEALPGSPIRLRGADTVARQALAFAHRASLAGIELVDGVPAIVVRSRGTVVTVLLLTVTGSKIAELDVVTDPQRLERFAFVPL